MSEIKISELPAAISVKESDSIPIVSEGETKRANKRAFNLTEKTAAFEKMMLDLGPSHYWPMDANILTVVDIVNDVVAGVIPARAVPALAHPIALGVERFGKSVTVNMEYDTQTLVSDLSKFTLCFLMRGIGTGLRIMGNHGANDLEGLAIFTNSNNGVNVILGDGVTSVRLDSPNNVVPNNETFFVVWSFDSDSGHLAYVNGSEVFSSTNTIIPSNSPFTWRIYNRGNRAQSFMFRGVMHDAAIFKKVLTPQEIGDLTDAILGT
jgi:hypothetical protein